MKLRGEAAICTADLGDQILSDWNVLDRSPYKGYALQPSDDDEHELQTFRSLGIPPNVPSGPRWARSSAPASPCAALLAALRTLLLP